MSSDVGAGRFVGGGASGSALAAADRRSATGLGAGAPLVGASGRIGRERRISWWSWVVSASGCVLSSRFSASAQSWYWRNAASRRPSRV
jgi:hypothetical protein